MLLYHATQLKAADAIDADGFRGGYSPGMAEVDEVVLWFSDHPAPFGEVTFCIDVPNSVAADCRVEYDADDDPELGYNEYVIPAAVANSYPRRRLTDDEVASASIALSKRLGLG